LTPRWGRGIVTHPITKFTIWFSAKQHRFY